MILTEAQSKTFTITVSVDPKGGLRFAPSANVEAEANDHIVWKSTDGDLALYINGRLEDTTPPRKSPFVKFLYSDGRQNGQPESKINPQVKGNPDLGTYKYTIYLFCDNGDKYEEDPRIVIR